jgi:hypothetical protein
MNRAVEKIDVVENNGVPEKLSIDSGGGQTEQQALQIGRVTDKSPRFLSLG